LVLLVLLELLVLLVLLVLLLLLLLLFGCFEGLDRPCFGDCAMWERGPGWVL
jgi:hypothetical protein